MQEWVKAGGIGDNMDGTYYEQVLSFVKGQARHYTIPTGIDPAVVEDVFTLEGVRFDVNRYVSSAFKGEEFVPDTSAAEEKLAENVTASFKRDGVTPSEETEQITKAYVEDIVKIYRQGTRLPGLDALASIRAQAKRYTLMGMVGIGLLAAVLVRLILRLHYFVHRGLRYVAYATGGAALMAFVVPFALYRSGFYLGLNLAPQHFYLFGTALVAHVLKACMLAAVVLVVVTIALIFVIAALRRRMVAHKRIRE